MDDGPYWVTLLKYGSHDMRHTGFRRLTVVNKTPGFWGVTSITLLPALSREKTLSYQPHLLGGVFNQIRTSDGALSHLGPTYR